MFICVIFVICTYIVEDWDLFEKMMDHLYERHIKSESELHPVLFTETSVSNSTPAYNMHIPVQLSVYMYVVEY